MTTDELNAKINRVIALVSAATKIDYNSLVEFSEGKAPAQVVGKLSLHFNKK